MRDVAALACTLALLSCGASRVNEAREEDSGAASETDAPSETGATSESSDAGGTVSTPPDAASPITVDSNDEALQALRYDPAPPPEDPSNRVADDAAARSFGQRLFFDAALSGPLIEGDNDGSGGTLGLRGEAGKVSCASCHLPESGFVDTRSPHRQISLAAQWTTRRTPTLHEIAFAPLYNWDGRRDSIWSQAAGVMESDREFNSSRLFIAQQIFRLHRTEYEAIFGPLPPLDDVARFPPLSPEEAGCIEISKSTGPVYECRGKPGDGADYDSMASADQALVTEVMVNAAKAIAAYVRLLRCGPSRFDQWLHGDADALSASEARGAALFVGKGECSSCHSGPNLTDGEFHNVGLTPAIVAVAFIDRDDRGAAAGIAALLDDPLNTQGAFSDGDRGVLPTTLGEELEGAFRTPTLRCAAAQPSFMHTGQYKSLSSVVAFFNDGGHQGGYPGRNELTPRGLTDGEREDLLAFLGALAGPGPDPSLLEAP